MLVSPNAGAVEQDKASPMLEMQRVLRFVAAGALNTTVSIVVYQLALFAFGYTVSYFIAYVSGIVLAYYAYAKHVFQAPMSLGRFAGFVVFYVVSLLAGNVLNAALVELLELSPRLAIFGTVAIMLPINYMGSKLCMLGYQATIAPRDPASGADET